MRIWTTSIRTRDRAVKATGATFKDITYKTGDRLFAPDWNNVVDFQAGRLAWEEFTLRYNKKMDELFASFEHDIIRFCQQDRAVIGCYCKSKTICHRYLLIEKLRAFCEVRGIEFAYGGEVR